jgi:hypothetical protein
MPVRRRDRAELSTSTVLIYPAHEIDSGEYRQYLISPLSFIGLLMRRP